MSVVAGIDFSTHAVDVVLLDEDTLDAAWHRFLLEAFGDAFDRTRWVRDSMPSRSWWEDHGVIAVGIEDPRGYGAGSLYRVQGAVLACLPTSLLVHPWIPSAWRKANGIPGNASKQAIEDHSLAIQPCEILAYAPDWPQDAHDAHLIARATLSSLQRTQEAA